jgi:hypothetical protein
MMEGGYLEWCGAGRQHTLLNDSASIQCLIYLGGVWYYEYVHNIMYIHSLCIRIR